jgi:hypothetical protein
MAAPFDRLIPRTLVERILAVLVALLLIGLVASKFQTFYYWGDHDCMKYTWTGSYAVAPKFCNDAEAEKAEKQRLRRERGL